MWEQKVDSRTIQTKAAAQALMQARPASSENLRDSANMAKPAVETRAQVQAATKKCHSAIQLRQIRKIQETGHVKTRARKKRRRS